MFAEPGNAPPRPRMLSVDDQGLRDIAVASAITIGHLAAGGRTTLYVWEIAKRLGLSEKKLFNDIDSGALVVMDFKASGVSRRCPQAHRRGDA